MMTIASKLWTPVNMMSVFKMQICTVCCKQDKVAIQYRFLEKVAAMLGSVIDTRKAEGTAQKGSGGSST